MPLKLILLKHPNSLVCLDGGEVIDTDNLKSIDWKDLQVIITRVADTALNDVFNSLRIGG